MPTKPTEQEDEYFARLEFERRRKVLDERETRAAEEEERRILSVVRGRCPKCGAELIPVPYRGIELSPRLSRAPSRPTAAPAGSGGRRYAIPADNGMATG